MLKFNSAELKNPCVPEGTTASDKFTYPKECRLRANTYKGRLSVSVGWSFNDVVQMPLERTLGDVPIMVGSECCNLDGFTPEEMVKKGEHEQEWGGYFIVKGHEKILRMLSAIRKNYPMTIQRDSWKRRGRMFTDLGVYIRCVKEDMTSTNNVMHYLQNGTIKFMCSYRRSMFFLPLVLILKALTNRPDLYIYEQLILGMEDDLYYKDRVAFMLRQLQMEGLYTTEQVRRYIGKHFRVQLSESPSWWTDEEVCSHLLQQSVAIHLGSDEDKFNLLTYMSRKMFVFAQGKCAMEGMDDVMMQEITLAGHVYMQLLKDRLTNWLSSVKYLMLKKARSQKKFSVSVGEMSTVLAQCSRLDAPIESFLATGNLPTGADIGLLQDSGITPFNRLLESFLSNQFSNDLDF